MPILPTHRPPAMILLQQVKPIVAKTPKNDLFAGGEAIFSPLASVPWVAQWKFNNDGLDSIGANHLTNNNSATFTEGKLGGATGATQLVKASSQYWSIADNAALSTGVNIDCFMGAWVYLDSKPEYIMGIVAKAGGSGGSDVIEYALYWNNESDRFMCTVADGSVQASAIASSFGSPALSTWYLVVGWYDKTNGTVNIQVNDGTTDSVSFTNGLWNSTYPLQVGLCFGSNRLWNGRIDNVCIAKSAAGAGGVLTAAQRTAFYQNGVGTEQIT